MKTTRTMKMMKGFLFFLALCFMGINVEAAEKPEKKNTDVSVSAPSKVELSFRMRYNYPTRTSGKISVLVSTDFNGKRESFEDIQAATWTDVTDRSHIDYESNAFAPSGDVDITDLWKEGKPIYVAFKYVFDRAEGNRQGATVWINNLEVKAVTEQGETVLSSDMASDFLEYSTGDANKNPTRSENRAALGKGKGLLTQANFHHKKTVNGETYTNRTRTEDYFVSIPYYVNKK